MSREVNEAAWDWTESAHVCMALWEVGFCGPESAERGPIMMAAKEKSVEAFLAGAVWQREQDAVKLEEAAEHQAMVDQHHAWDRTRQVEVEPCFEPGHAKYHSYFGCAAHVVGQMAKVIRGEPAQTSDDYKPWKIEPVQPIGGCGHGPHLTCSNCQVGRNALEVSQNEGVWKSQTCKHGVELALYGCGDGCAWQAQQVPQAKESGK